MANDITTTRSNVFQVTDIDKFKKIMDKVHTCEDEIEVVIDSEKEKKVSFGAYDDIIGFVDKNGQVYDNSYDDFLHELQTVIPDKEACIITTIGHCKLRYLYAYANIVTNNQIESADLTNNTSIEIAKRLTQNNEFCFNW